jgi:nucleoporin NUP42
MAQADPPPTFRSDLPYHLSREALRKDLTEERPPWILSSFGPGRDAPEQLFGGYPREQSFEELRLHYNNAAAAGNPQSAVSLHEKGERKTT